MSDERLPFPIHGARTGEDAPTDAAGEAARLLYVVNLIASTAKVPVFSMSQDIDGGTVHAAVYGPLAFKWVTGVKKEEEEEAPEAVRLVWVPDGFAITPRMPTAPNGFGMPPTTDGKGTPGGPLTQVIINKYKDNQYPDAIFKSRGDPDSEDALLRAPFFFMDWERTGAAPIPKRSITGIGMPVTNGKKTEWTQQFDDKAQSRWARNFTEIESKNWHCHRPMHAIEYMGEIRAAILKETNLLRESGGRANFNPPIRGMEGVLPASVLYQMDYAGQIEHDHPDYREGYKTFPDRAKSREGEVAGGAGENLLATTATISGADFGIAAVDGWRNSPGHYANMMDLWEDDSWALLRDLPIEEHELYPTLDPGIRAGSSIPSFSTGPVSTAAQIFHSHEDWVVPVLPSRKNDPNHCIGVHPDFGHSARYFGWSRNIFERDAGTDVGDPGYGKRLTGSTHMSVKGRLTPYRTKDDNPMVLLAACTARIKPKSLSDVLRQVIRIAVIEKFTPNSYIDRALVLYEGDAADFLETRVELARYVMDKGQQDMSTPRFSASGDRLVFSYAELVVADSSQGNLIDAWPAPGPVGAKVTRPAFTDPMGVIASHMWGDELHFMEWVYGRPNGAPPFQEISTDSLTVQVELTPVLDNTLGGPRDQWSASTVGSYRSFCVGECNYLADYDKETVVYLRIRVNCDHRLAGTAIEEVAPRGGNGSLPAYVLKQKGTLIFPDETKTEIVYQDRTIIPYLYSDVGMSTVSGFFSHLCHVDVLNPHLTTVIRHDVGAISNAVAGSPEKFETRFTSRSTVRVGKKMVKDLGEVLKQPALDAVVPSYVGSFEYLHTGVCFPYDLYTDFDWKKSAEESSAIFGQQIVFFMDIRSSGRREGIVRQTPIAPFKASLVSPTIFHSNVEDLVEQGLAAAGNRAFADRTFTPYSALLLGPLVLPGTSGIYGRSRNQRVSAAVHGGKYIVAGCVQRPLPVTEHTEDPERVYYRDSDLDLESITGMVLLDDNIMPIGVL